MKRICLAIFVLWLPIICYTQNNNEDIVGKVHIVRMVDTAFYAVFDTLIQVEKENGIVRNSNCVIYVNVNKGGLVGITSLDNRMGEIPCIPQMIVEQTLVTKYKNRFVYIIFVDRNAMEWIEVDATNMFIYTCIDGEENNESKNDEKYDYPCAVVYAMHDKMHMRVIGKEVMSYLNLFQ